MTSLSEIVGKSEKRIGNEIRESFGRNGFENALLVALDKNGMIVEWGADLAGVTLPAFAAFAPEETDRIVVWAWRSANEFEEPQDFKLRGPLLDPPTPPFPLAFRPRLPGINNPSHREPAYTGAEA